MLPVTPTCSRTRPSCTSPTNYSQAFGNGQQRSVGCIRRVRFCFLLFLHYLLYFLSRVAHPISSSLLPDKAYTRSLEVRAGSCASYCYVHALPPKTAPPGATPATPHLRSYTEPTLSLSTPTSKPHLGCHGALAPTSFAATFILVISWLCS